MPHTRKSFLENARTPAVPCRALYVHVPICRRRCRYCDFCSMVCDDGLAARIADALLSELNHRKEAMRHPLTTAFVGGGTPTALPPRLLASLLAAIGDCGDGGTEFTVEANPGTLDDQTLATLKNVGVNRLSVGVQSFVKTELMTLGRMHDAEQARQVISRAAAAGMTSISVDLIYGIPGQTLQTWTSSLQATLDLPVQHISCYCLSYGEGTPITADLAAGRLHPMAEDLQHRCYEQAITLLADAGVIQYEISNFAKGNRVCRHNLTYWNNRPYIGIGPSAVSYVGGIRSANTDRIEHYVHCMEQGTSAMASSEHLTGHSLMAETLMLALRLRKGCNIKHFQRRFGVSPFDTFGEVLKRYEGMDILSTNAERIALTPRGLFVSDAVFADLFEQANSNPR